MPFVTRKTLLVMGALSGAAVLAAAGFVWSGVYNIAANDLHTRPVHALMHKMRERSITVRANKHAVAGMDMNRDQTTASGRSSNAAPEIVEHQHADGAVESHPAPLTQPQSVKAENAHDHQHCLHGGSPHEIEFVMTLLSTETNDGAKEHGRRLAHRLQPLVLAGQESQVRHDR